jgi:hydrogenase nickel incorporation protein HypA/HybF
MHETAICSALLAEVERVARTQNANAVTRVRVAIGPLAGVESQLLRRAYELARAGTIAAEAPLEIEQTCIEVTCKACGARTRAEPQRVVCGECGDWRTQLVSGDELVLSQVELLADLH